MRYKLVAILNLKVKASANCKFGVKYEFLDPQNPKNDVSCCNFGQLI